MGKKAETHLQETDFSKWYLQAIQQGDLFAYGPVRGTIIFKPDGYELWERYKEAFNARLQAEGIRNAYFPMLIPESYFLKEKDHVEGFAPELPWVTEAAGEELEERLALRPTSETVIGGAMSEWINSYRDLPMELNQWANVFRWEKRTLPFLRTSEFLWQEGHTAHASEEEARERTMTMLKIYEELCEDLLAMPVYSGQKTPSERFAGAVDTYSIEAMMKDTKAVQAGTSHYMGTNFADAFDIKYLNSDNEHVLAYTTSWGTSTRLLGALIMTHGDEQGLVLPPKMAATQVVLIPAGNMKKNPEVLDRLVELRSELQDAGLRVRLDDSNNSAGYKFNDAEVHGVPLRVEFGPRDMANDQVMIKMRDLDDKESLRLEGLAEAIQERLDTMQVRLLDKAKEFRKTHEHYDIDTLEDLKAHIAKCEENGQRPGWVLAGWDGTDESEAAIKEATGFTSRNIPFDPPMEKSVDLYSGKPAKYTVWFARAY
ncbi:proline--tRNA ligase [Aerococcus kribbianus]|uniref:Proline--tRNA ligase n=1 Tax=Aerococcus kribbianus TaxID=2999064 RepID=A0A9X3JGR1_9LACT|nr:MULTISPECIES: proline--tRNA ligase [unclassified Aerococcus]MCZ0717531.1 proline--tRNA ligase [Aerococcus sp. YH-aer221]MCZ0725819.1 proline--tRNA ligase [Aerococcus sp. YH-aer222]